MDTSRFSMAYIVAEGGRRFLVDTVVGQMAPVSLIENSKGRDGE
jgi:hypothetical protein